MQQKLTATQVSIGVADLNDALIIAPANGEVLTFNGSEWVNAASGNFDPTAPGPIGGITPGAATFTTVTADGVVNLTAGLQISGSGGSMGQVPTSNGTGGLAWSTPSGTANPDLAAQIATAAKTLRRTLESSRPEPSSTQRGLNYAGFNLAKQTNTDGNLTVWEPDGSGFYGMAWTRDQAMAFEAFNEYFTPAEIGAVATYWLSKSNTTTGEVPDHISQTGTVFMAPAPSGRGSRAPIDGNFFLIQMFWLHYVMTGAPTLYEAHKVALKQILEYSGLYNSVSGCTMVDDSSPYVGFGFFDMAEITGDVAFTTILAVRAYQMAAEMEYAGGDDSEAARLLARSVVLVNGFNTVFVKTSAAITAQQNAPYYMREIASVELGTIKGVNQIDLWSTAYAVWCDIVPDPVKRQMANYLLYTVSVNSDNYYRGGLRNVDKATDYNPGTDVFQGIFFEWPYGHYQNGGYWPTPMPWLIYTIGLIDPTKARKLYLDMHTYSLQQGAASFGEWWNQTSVFGATIYLSSMSALLVMNQSQIPTIVADAWEGLYRAVANETIMLVLQAPFSGTITSTTTKCASGTATATFNINGANLGGTANSVSTSLQTQPQLTGNTFNKGDTITMSISNNAAAADIEFSINYLRAA